MGPREHYARTEPGRFGDAELLALVLGTGTSRRSALEIAADLLVTCSGPAGLARRSVPELCAVSGVGMARAVRIHAAVQLGRRSLSAPPTASPVCTPAAAWAELGPGLQGLADEELHALYLDRRRRTLCRRVLTRGTDGLTIVDPRQVFRAAVGLGASAVILAHNHPSGDRNPSPQDRAVTRRVAQAGNLLGVPLLDHLIVTATGFTSMAEAGLLPSWERPPPSVAAEN